MGVSPMGAVRRTVDRYTGRHNKSEAFFSARKKKRSARVDSVGITTEIAAYRDQGRDAHGNPTATGLVITIPPYEVGPWADGTFTVMLPYKILGDVIRSDGPLGRFMDADKTSASVSP